MGDRVDVLDARNLAQQLLHWHANPLLHFARRRSRHLHEDVEHGYDDLRLLLARRLPDAERAGQERGKDRQRRQLRNDERVRNLARGSQIEWIAHWITLPA